jgi:peroxiredoxin family protein
MAEETKTNKLSIVCFSGDFDKALPMLILGTGASAFDYEVNLFFTFWGLNIIKKKKGRLPYGKQFLEKIFNVMMGGRNNLPMSKFNFGGMGPKMMQSMMKQKKIKGLEELLKDATDMGCNIYACDMAMHVMGIKREDLIDEVKDVVGVGTFIANAEGGQMLFI